MKARLSLLVWFFLVVLGKGLFAQEFKTEIGRVSFLSKAPMNEFTGTSAQLNGLIDLEKNLLDFYVDLNTLQTGIGLRDRHMRDNYLETKKYPFAEFTGKMESIPSLSIGESKPVVAKGVFKIHGVQKEISVKGTIKLVSANELLLDASFPILLGDYKIEIPSVVFYELGEEQLVTIQGNLKK
jgi:polyisoprenoid-binding protein YceI